MVPKGVQCLGFWWSWNLSQQKQQFDDEESQAGFVFLYLGEWVCVLLNPMSGRTAVPFNKWSYVHLLFLATLI